MKYLMKLESFTERKTYIKQYEKLSNDIKKTDKNRPHANDYVWVDDELFSLPNDHIEYRNFINNNVGKITTIDTRRISYLYKI